MVEIDCKKVTYLVGNLDIINTMIGAKSLPPFADEAVSYLTDVSRLLMANKVNRVYSDVITFAFWIRNASLNVLREKYSPKDGYQHLGRGIIFHIAPSNVPVNFAYSLAAGLLTGNANIVRVPSKDFEQISIISEAFKSALEKHEAMKNRVVLVRYDRSKDINDVLSSIADVRVIWGGDLTISEIRQSPLPPRSTEVTFADRYSLALIDSDSYLCNDNKKRIAEDFYNDTYFSDQNACTSPRAVIWTGTRKEEAKELFWQKLHALLKEKYGFQDIQGVNKLTSALIAAVNVEGVHIIKSEDNLITRVQINKLTDKIINYMDNSGFFFECDCNDVSDLSDICNNRKCQTVGVLGDFEKLKSMIASGIHGVDRLVPIGHTMDFDLVWDGYNLMYSFTRTLVA